MKRETAVANRQIYYRLIAVWVLCEAMLGGIIHGLRIPVSGLIIGSCAVVCISLIAWYVPARGAILKATIIVAVFKMMLSPQAPPPAYIAVFFQGLMGELLFRNRKYFKLSCLLLAPIALLESGLQRILVLTIVYGNGLWTTLNSFINGLTKQKIATNYSLLIGSAYVLLHLITGIFVGWQAALLPGRILLWTKDQQYRVEPASTVTATLPGKTKKRKWLKKGILVVWLLLIGLYVQSYFKLGEPLLPAHISLEILLRSVIIVLGWIFFIGPVLTQLLHRWLKKKQSRSQQEIQEVLNLLPSTQRLLGESWKRSSVHKGIKRISVFGKMVLVNTLSPLSTSRRGAGLVRRNFSEGGAGVFILTAPIQSGKTTSLLNWAAGRNDVYGILTPVVNGQRIFMNVHTKEQFPMEAFIDESDIFSVGRFKFSKKNFEKAIALLKDNSGKKGWLLIDEIGPLELRDEGFGEVIKELIFHCKGKLLLVVREGLLNQVIEYFELEQAVIVTGIANLKEIGRGNCTPAQ
ncbi:MAG: nucleoside-triphosphatase [Chitinophagaceae bacterium]